MLSLMIFSKAQRQILVLELDMVLNNKVTPELKNVIIKKNIFD